MIVKKVYAGAYEVYGTPSWDMNDKYLLGHIQKVKQQWYATSNKNELGFFDTKEEAAKAILEFNNKSLSGTLTYM